MTIGAVDTLVATPETGARPMGDLPVPDATHRLAAVWDDSRALLREYAQTRDIRVRNRLVVLHERIVRHVVARFGPGSGTTTEDLMQVGYIGLIAAIERFDPDRGVCFITFAVPTIVGEIKRHFRDHTWSVKAPRR